MTIPSPSERPWSLMPAVMELLDHLETRLCAAPPVDGLRCCGLWLKLYADGSGSVMCAYRRASINETPTQRAIDTVLMEEHELEPFDSLPALHGMLVSRTCSTRREGA